MSFKISTNLKSHLVKNFGLAADASDEVANVLISEELMKDDAKLTIKQIKELNASGSGGSAVDKVRDLISSEVSSQIKSHVDPLSSKIDMLIAGLGVNGGDGASATGQGTKAVGQTAPAAGVKAIGGSPVDALVAGAGSGDADQSSIRIKAIVEHFDNTKTAAVYGTHSKNPYLQKHFGDQGVWTGEVGKPLSRSLDMPTQRDKAIAGAWLKKMVHDACGGRNVPNACRYTELDRKLIEYAVHECKFVGPLEYNEGSDTAKHWAEGSKLPELWVKTLLDDSTSGGLEAVPIEFDSLAIITPLLNGELFPLVTVRNVSRRRIEGFSISNPTINWGVAEGTEIALFNTDSFIAAFDTTIFPVTGGIESGLDFEDDSPVAIGDIIIQRYGEVFLEEMDKVIASGNGTTQPLGVFGASGTATITCDNTTVGPPTVADYEKLLFGVAKEYRSPAERARQVFIANETTYRRARGIAVGTSDQRRVFGMDEESYMLMDHPYKIQQGLANGYIGFFNMRYYRMYRRTGFNVRVVTEDKELARANKRLILVRARMGGQLELGGSGAVTTAAQS